MPVRIILLFVALAVSTVGCAVVQPVNPAGPRRNQPLYPVVLADTLQRTEGATATWAQLSNQQGIPGKSMVSLQPVTATIQRLPDNMSGFLYLPKVGTTTEMNEEETRESLRRFLNEWQQLLGADPSQLSLVQRTTNSDGTKTAVYEQRPFSYPLRGGYGKVEVRFAPNRRVLNLSSTAIPDSERIQTALSAATTRLKGFEPTKVIGRSFTYSDTVGTHTYAISPDNQISVQQLVVYPRLVLDNVAALEFHLAWEINLTNAAVKTIYLDALQDDVIAVSQ